MWTAKSSSSGFSVSLYLPSGAMTEKVKPKRNRRRRKRPKASITNLITDVATSYWSNQLLESIHALLSREEPDISLSILNSKAHLHLLYTRTLHVCNITEAQ